MNPPRKGFTLVELVIVIAIIAILAAVLIPTFTGSVKKANQSKALQTAQNEFIETYAEALADDGKLTDESSPNGDEGVTVTGGEIKLETANFIFTLNDDYRITGVEAKSDSEHAAYGEYVRSRMKEAD